MASGAGALRISLGGSARYHGELLERSVLGAGRAPVVGDLTRSINLVNYQLAVWLGIALLLGFFA